jgi:glycosyltransferase involved in cell wall biosynthesis
MAQFSVTLSVYKNDSPLYFRDAMSSIIDQTIPPNEIVLTVDGPVTSDIDEVINDFQHKINYLNVIRISENQGRGIAHKIGIEHCSHQLIAIMDSDDIAVHDRFEKQLQYFEQNPDIDVLGGYICEFIDAVKNIVGIREVPLNDRDIKKYLKKRCPFNHMTVMFKKESVLKSGNYQGWHFYEDYDLWCRMFLNGYKFNNISDILVYARVGKDMYNRRGGWKYFKSEEKLHKFMLDNKMITVLEYTINVIIRIVQTMMPANIRKFIYQHFFRKHIC